MMIRSNKSFGIVVLLLTLALSCPGLAAGGGKAKSSKGDKQANTESGETKSPPTIELPRVPVVFHGGQEPGNHGGNAQRTGYVPFDLRPPFQLSWVHVSRHQPLPAWKEPVWEPQRIDFDYAFPISAGSNTVYYSSSADHAVHALDLATGRTKWKFFAEGPVRLSPTLHGGKIYFGADDGVVYCLEGQSGKLLWKYRPAIPDERLIGNEQMISRWPARSGVLIEDGKAYVTFGMLAQEGVWVCCLDATNGTCLWQNDTAGFHYMARPHTPGMGGVSPQGYLALGEETLVVPCGRATPALFDKLSGRLLYHECEGDFAGGAWTMTYGPMVFTPCESLKKEYGSSLRRDFTNAEAKVFASASLVALHPTTGRELFTLQGGRRAVISDQGLMTLVGPGRLQCLDLRDVVARRDKESTIQHTTGRFVSGPDIARWKTSVEAVYALRQARNTLIAGGKNTVMGYDADTGQQIWETTVEGQARDLCLVPGHLLVSTTAGRIYCFRAGPPVGAEAKPAVLAPDTAAIPSPDARQFAEAVLGLAGARDGYCLAAGDMNAEALTALAAQSRLVVCHPTKSDGAEALRRELDRTGLYGSRVAVHECATQPLPYADYFAEVIVFNAARLAALEQFPASELQRVLRPYGGVAVILCPDDLQAKVQAWWQAGNSDGSPLQRVAKGLLWRRGELQGAGEWTHQFADPGKSCASTDTLARLPLKTLWFGGLGPEKIVSRHFRTPAPLVVKGRCFVSGTDDLMAMDIYNGRLLWTRPIANFAHWPVQYRGPAIAADHHAVYALEARRCLRLDPATGQMQAVYEPPTSQSSTAPASPDEIWEYLAVTDKYVIGSLGEPNVKKEWYSKAYPANHTLFVLDKSSGKTVWSFQPEAPVDSNAIAIESNRVFLIEGRPHYSVIFKSKLPSTARTIKALDLDTGRKLWETRESAPTQNSLWVHDGVLVATINPFSRGLEDPMVSQTGGGACAYSATTGARLWQLDALGSCSPVLVNNAIFFPEAYDLRTGKPLPQANPLTGEPGDFSPGFPRACSALSGSPNLLMSRSGSLGFFDLAQRSGYYHYSIVRASCYINMVAAGGLVVVPEGSSSCVCGYNYKMSVALMPDDRHYSYGVSRIRSGANLAQLRVNLGAPGDRADAAGNLWHAWPRPTAFGRPLANARYGPKVAGGELPIESTGPHQSWTEYAMNPDWAAIKDTPNPWLFACGLTGPLQLKIRLSGNPATSGHYQVILHFCELDTLPSPRVFDVKLQGQTVLKNFNIFSETGGSRKALSKPFSVQAANTLTLELVAADVNSPAPILSGLEILRK